MPDATATASETVMTVESQPTTYRLLDPAEWPRIVEVFERYGVAPPHPDLSLIAVAERDGEIVGLLTAQPMVHLEPLYVAPEHTADVYIPSLVHLVEGTLRTVAKGQPIDVYALSGSPAVGKLAKAMGFTHQPYHVWKKRLDAEVK